MRIASSFFAVGSLVVTVVACSGSNDENVFVAISPTTQQALAGTFCNKTAECTSDVFLQVQYGSSDTCKSRLLTEFQRAAKGVGYGVSEQGATACNSALATVACRDLLDGKLPDACKFTGSLADGTSCTDDGQCASGSCFIDDTATCGKCGPRVALGADCTNANCERGLKCGSTKTCTNGQPGAACGKDADCRALTLCRAGACVELLPEGAACTAGGDNVPCDLTKALSCLPKQVPNPAGTCAKVALSFAGNGEACGEPTVKLSPFAVTVCTNGDCKDNKCVTRPGDGTTCTATGQECQAPAKCRNGVCALKDPTVCK